MDKRLELVTRNTEDIVSMEELETLLRAVGRSRTQLKARFAELRLGKTQEFVDIQRCQPRDHICLKRETR